MNGDEQNDFWDSLSGILLRGFFLSYALLLVWFLFYLLAGDFGSAISSQWFPVSRHDYDLVNYCGMAFVKMCALQFFLVPYLAVKLVSRKKKKGR